MPDSQLEYKCKHKRCAHAQFYFLVQKTKLSMRTSLAFGFACESGISYFTLNIFSFAFPSNKNKNKCQKMPTSMHHSVGLIPQPWKRGWLVSNGIPLRGLEVEREVVIGDDIHSTNVAVQW